MDCEESGGGWARRIRSKKLREHQYREGYARFLEGKKVEWDGDYNVERRKLESAKEVCDSLRVRRKNPKSVWWNDKMKAAVRRK